MKILPFPQQQLLQMTVIGVAGINHLNLDHICHPHHCCLSLSISLSSYPAFSYGKFGFIFWHHSERHFSIGLLPIYDCALRYFIQDWDGC